MSPILVRTKENAYKLLKVDSDVSAKKDTLVKTASFVSLNSSPRKSDECLIYVCSFLMFSVLSCFDFKVKYRELETYSNVTTREGKSYDIFCCFITFNHCLM